MPATKIMVIRHAEKPNGLPNGAPGLMPDGTPNPEALTALGWRRAEALVGLFVPPGGHFADPHLATPRAIFASGVAYHSDSQRSQQTVTPIAEKLALPIDTNYPKHDESRLVQAAAATDGIILIAWEHEAIPKIAALIRGTDAGVPAHWPDDRFDLVWVFDREIGGATWSFLQVPQLLLPGDLADPIPLT